MLLGAEVSAGGRVGMGGRREAYVGVNQRIRSNGSCGHIGKESASPHRSQRKGTVLLGAEVARKAHNLKVVGSKPTEAISFCPVTLRFFFFIKSPHP